MKIESKILNGIERISEVMKSLLWEKAKLHGISPIQIQILLFISEHKTELSNVSYLAKEFNVTKATISDAVRVLVLKGYLKKDFSPTDNRRYNLKLSNEGQNLIYELSEYASTVREELANFTDKELTSFFSTLSKLIYKLNQKEVIQIQRTCFNCRHYDGDKKTQHFCKLLSTKLKAQDIRLDCNEFESIT